MSMDIKDRYVEELKKAGYTVEIKQGVPTVLVSDASEFPQVKKRLRKLQESTGYNCSWGIAAKAGTVPIQHKEVDVVDETEETMPDEEPEREHGSDDLTVDESGQLSFV